ncbi:B-box zinc finger protein 21-like protein [Drosera capensis]
MKHNRFLLTGVKLSSIAAAAATATKDSVKVASDSGRCDLVPDFKSQNSNIKKTVSVETQVSAPSLNSKGIDANSNVENDASSLLIYDSGVGGGGGGCASSISEYLMEMLPGWQVDDFLDPGSSPFGLSKSCDDGMISFGDTDPGKNNEVVYSHEMMGIWVPQAPTMAVESPYTNSITFGLSGFGGEKKMETSRKGTNSRKRVEDGFTVPQMSSQATGSKRTKTFW